LGISVCIAVFWFGNAYQYNALLVGPFENGPNCQEQLQMVKNATERASVQHDWMQVVLFLASNAIIPLLTADLLHCLILATIPYGQQKG